MNILKNSSFDESDDSGHGVLVIPQTGEPYFRERGENTNPKGWFTYMRHGLPVEHDPNNKVGWSEVESAPILAQAPYLNPPRVKTAPGATKMFTYHRIHDAGFGQSVRVVSGSKIKAGFYAHAWSSQDDNPNTSEGVDGAGYWLEGSTQDDTLKNATLRVGVKFHRNVQYQDGIPLLDDNPFEGDVTWGQGAHIYNVYAQVPELVFDVPNDVEWVTFYTRSRYLWAFKHCDAYVDNCYLALVEDVPPVEGDRLLIAKGSKCGTHSIWPDGIVNMCQRLKDAGARMPVVKVVDDPGYLHQVKAIDPGILTVLRFTSPDEGLTCLHDSNYSLQKAADMLMKPIFNALNNNPDLAYLVDRWEVCNEPGGGGVSSVFYVRVAETMKLCMDMAEAKEIKLAIFSFNAGTPEWVDMLAICETGIFEQAVKGGHWLTLHEGLLPMDGAPPLEEMPIDWCQGDMIPGAPYMLEGAGCLIGRYKYFQLAMEMTNQPCPSIVFSEFRFGGKISEPDKIVNERLKWCDELYRADPYVLAFCPFTWGPTPGWQSMDYGPITEPMLAYQISIKDESNAIWDDEPEPPLVIEGAPREPYDRLYVVLDPGRLTVKEMGEIVDGWWKSSQFVTFGPSYDDAMAHYGLTYPDGTTNVKTIVYNWTHEERLALEEFRDLYYPLAEIEFRDYPPVPTPAEKVLVGVHDEGGCQYMLDQGVDTVALIPSIVKDQPVTLDYRHLHRVGQETFVIARLNWGWAGQDGTMPPKKYLESHVNAIVQTIRQSKGVDGYQFWNEVNNLGEHPPDFALTPAYVRDAYNMVYDVVGDEALMAPPPIDPYFGPNSDNRKWKETIWNGIHGAGFLIFHAGKSQTNDPASIWSDVKFGDEPLTWQYLNSKTLYTEMEQVPPRFMDLPVFLGEANPQYKTQIGGDLGWISVNTKWISEFMRFVRAWNDRAIQTVRGVIFYRWDFDQWALRGSKTLEQIVQEARK